MFITYGWYVDEWWILPTTSSEYDCTDEQIASVLPYTLAPVQREYPADLDSVTETGIVSIWNVLSYAVHYPTMLAFAKQTVIHATLFSGAKSALETVCGIRISNCSTYTSQKQFIRFIPNVSTT